MNMQRRWLQGKEGTQVWYGCLSSEKDGNILTTIHSYKLPHRVYSSTVYPRRSSNGSNIIIYAHEQGLRIIWYGGRRFKSLVKSVEAVNGNSISLDDEDEDIPVQYEDFEDDSDIDGIPQDVLTSYDVNFGTACSRLAIPPLCPNRTVEDSPPIIESHIIVAAACADLSLKLVALPLEPARPGFTKCQVVTVAGANTHQDVISGLAITLTAETSEGDNYGTLARTQSRATVTEEGHPNTTPQKWSILMASASPTGNGLLLTHLVPIVSAGIISTNPEDHIPVQRQSARTSLVNCQLSFNTSTYPDERHTHLLVSRYDDPAVKVYQALSKLSNKKKRRDSVTTVDSVTSTNKSIRSSSSTSGRPLITLLPPFNQDEWSKFMPYRKRVLDTKWILQGQAVITLLEDGSWGIWDLESTGPSLPDSPNSHKPGMEGTSGIQGGSLTKFALRGTVKSSSQTTKRPNKDSQPLASNSLAPMTPHTRKVRSQGLFNAKEAKETVRSEDEHTSTGSISILSQTQTSTKQPQGYDESVLLNYGIASVFIPAISKFWRSSLGSRGVFEGSMANRPATLPSVCVPGEARQSVDLLPPETSSTSTSSATGQAYIPSFVITCASQMVIFIPPKTDKTMSQQSISSLPIRFPLEKVSGSEQFLLRSGELDIDGMDRILNDMANGSVSQSFTTNASDKRAVGFLVDEDEDMEMNTPTQSRSNKSKLVVARDSGNGRRLFT